MSQNMSQYNSSMVDMFSQLDTNITNQYQNLFNTVNNYDANQQEGLDNLIKVLDQKLQQVFQYVSDGKRKLASALLTKGVSIREDATFEEIYRAILAVPQQLVIGVQKIPGTISYDYHYHVNAGGSMNHSAQEPIRGGCYMAPVYHVHTGNSSGGGCYTAPIIHTHTSDCYSEGSHDSSCPSHIEFHSYDCGGVHDWDDDGHGCDGFTAYDCDGHTYLSCNKGNGVVGYSLNCGKSTSTIEYYVPSCGLSDGQIIGAHIVYTQSAVSYARAAAYAAHSMEEEEVSEVLIEEAVDTGADGVVSSGETDTGEKTGSADAVSGNDAEAIGAGEAEMERTETKGIETEGAGTEEEDGFATEETEEIADGSIETDTARTEAVDSEGEGMEKEGMEEESSGLENAEETSADMEHGDMMEESQEMN